jgi:hypothetical protein
MILEAIECDAPFDSPLLVLRQTKRIIPADWWLHAAQNPKWVKVCDLRWWQLWRLRRIDQCWPCRLMHKGRVMWATKATLKS